MAEPLDIIIVERLGQLRVLSIKDFKEEELYKKCGFKKSEGFSKQTEWNVKCDGIKYFIQVFGKIDGRANSENKYDFPPPIDTTLFYGSCAIVGRVKRDSDGAKVTTNLSLQKWNKIYEKLFGGFEDLAATAKEDEEEEDELANVPKEKKTKHGYLKDGFVVDSSDTEDQTPSGSEETDDDDDDDDIDNDSDENNEDDDEVIIEDVGSELSEESYDYDDNDVEK
jgi:hypothetical protein